MSYVSMAILLSLIVLFFVLLVREFLDFDPSRYPYFFSIDWRERIRRDIGMSEEKWSELNEQEMVFFRDTYIQCKSMDVDLMVFEQIQLGHPNAKWGVQANFARFLVSDSNLGGRLEVAVKGNKADWFPKFVHATCQVDQWWSKDSAYWAGLCGMEDCREVIKKWVSGKDMPTWELEKAVRSSIRMELDCSRRGLDKIRKYGLSLDWETYIKKSNSMIGYYGFVRNERKWYNIAPELVEAVWSKQCEILMGEDDYFECMDYERELYQRHCILSVEFYGNKG